MDTLTTGYTRRDGIIAIVLIMAILLVAGTQLTYGMASWGDDFAAYMAEGISISEGTFEEQAVKNYSLHPTKLTTEADEGSLVYVWGFPLLLSVVHRLVGFDLVNYSSIIYYKIPSLLAFAFTAGVLYLFYRRYFSELLSGFLTLIFLASGEMIPAIDYLNVDITFLFWFVGSLLLAECFFDSILVFEGKKAAVLLGLGLGVCLWFTYETRLNGQTILLITLISYSIRLVRHRRKLSVREVSWSLLPYGVFLLLKLVTEASWMPATPNISDIGNLTLQQLVFNFRYYCTLTKEYLGGLTGEVDLFIWPVLTVFLLIGIFLDGLKWQNIPFTILLAGTYAVLILLPYTQGLRYLFNILPILLLYVALGGKRVVCWLISKKPVKHWKRVMCALAALIIILAYIPQIRGSTRNILNGRNVAETDVYSEEAIEVYRYIQEKIPQEDVIAFVKPRALYLNTGRMSIQWNVNGHAFENADYYLFSQHIYSLDDQKILEERMDELELVYENQTFRLYEIRK